MVLKIGINGLGRIGRNVVRAYSMRSEKEIEIVAANSPPASLDTHLHLLKYDSIHGRFPAFKKAGERQIDIGRNIINVVNEHSPVEVPWQKLGVDLVMECSGIFTAKDAALGHLKAGAKKVMISAPSPDPDITVVYGVNHELLTKDHDVISIGSCTTNCLAPVVKVLNNELGIEKGFMTTIHAYTNDQNLTDNKHKDLQRARAATMSMIPSSTGAAKALSLVIPEMKGKLDGVAVRVPTANVSMVDLTFVSKKATSVEEINNMLIKASETAGLKNILTVNHEPLVSIDFNTNPASAIVDLKETKVVDGNFCRVAAWYDNEWGFSNRMLDVAILLAKML